MTPKDLAALLNGREYRKEMTPQEEALAKAHGLVVVYGASDDLMEFRGAIDDELGSYGGATEYLSPTGLLRSECLEDQCPYFERLKADAPTIKAIWCPEGTGYSWAYETKIPHETFDIIEDGEPYCRGIVFALADVWLAMPGASWPKTNAA